MRVFVVYSDERLGYERTQRLKEMQSALEQPDALRQREARGHLKASEKVGAAAARIL